MKTRPKRLIALSCFILAVAISLPLQILVLYGHAPWEVGAVLAKLSPLNWLILGLGTWTATLVYSASPWTLGALPALVVLVCYNNWLVASYGVNYTVTTTGIASLSFIFLIGAFLNRQVFGLLSNPRSRWWLTPPRKRVAVPVRLKLLSRKLPRRLPNEYLEAMNEFRIKTFDLSEGGAFIPLDQDEASQAFEMVFKHLGVGTQCYVSLPLENAGYLQCRAEIVRSTPGRGEYPAGVGIRFLGLSWADQRRLNGLLNQVA